MSFEDHDALFVRVGASRSLALLLACSHLGAGVCLAGADLPGPARAVAAAALAASLLRHLLDDAARLLSGSVIGVACDARGEWRLATRAGRLVEARLLPGGCAHPLCTVLRFRASDGRRLRVVVLPDAADAERMRRLRRRLRAPFTA